MLKNPAYPANLTESIAEYGEESEERECIDPEMRSRVSMDITESIAEYAEESEEPECIDPAIWEAGVPSWY